MNKQQKIAYNEGLITVTIIWLIGIFIIFIIGILCMNGEYEQDFQDGQANCTEIKNVNMTNITYAQWNTKEDKVEIQGLICSEGSILKVISQDRVGCVRK